MGIQQPVTETDRALAMVIEKDKQEAAAVKDIEPAGSVLDLDTLLAEEVLNECKRVELESVSVFKEPPSNDCRGANQVRQDEMAVEACQRALAKAKQENPGIRAAIARVRAQIEEIGRIIDQT